MEDVASQSLSEDLLFKVLENEYKKALDDVLAERRKITDPEVCNIFNLWYLSNHVHAIRAEMREGFAGLRREMGERFEKVDQRFEKVDQRFEKVDQRFERMEERFRWVFTLMGIGFTVIAVLIVIFQFVGRGG